MGAELTMSAAQMLAATVNAVTGNSDASHLRQSPAALIGALYAATVGGSSPHLTMSVPAMLAAIRNNVSDDPDVTATNTSVEDLLAQINNAWSDDPDLSARTSSVGKLLAGMLGSATPVDGGGSGETYAASAVNFDSATVLLGTLTGTDGPLLAFSVWVKRDPAFGLTSFFQSDNGATMLIEGSGSSFRPNALKVQITSADFALLVGTGSAVNWYSTTPIVDTDWHHLLIGIDCTDADHDNWKIAAYLDDAPFAMAVDTLPFDLPDYGHALGEPYLYGNGPLNIAMFNCNMQVVDWSDIIISEDVADLITYTDQSLLTGTAIVEATRRLFIDAGGKPVDPAVAVAEIGAPTMLFSGDATGFVTNQGDGGAFAISEGTLTDASSSPSD